MSGSQPATPRPRALKALAFASGIAVAIVVGIALRDRLPANVPPEPAPAPGKPLAPSATLELTRADLPASGPVRVTLGLAVPSAAGGPRPVRVVSQPDHRILELAAVLDPDRTAATIEIDRAWLLPGSYLVELRMTERSPLQMRSWCAEPARAGATWRERRRGSRGWGRFLRAVQRESLRCALPYLAFFSGVLLAIGVGYAWWKPDAAREVRPVVPAPASTGQHAPAGAAEPARGAGAEAQPAPTAATSQTKPLAPFGTLQMTRADFPDSGPVIVSLDLGGPSADDSPRLVRMFSVTDQRGILTEVQLDSTRSVGTLQLDPNFLQPGEYFVEVQTTERSAFPLRRYAIVVR